MTRPRFILASASPRRLQLLTQAGYVPDEIISPDIDETVQKDELPSAHAQRLALEKAQLIAVRYPDAVVLAADTVVACGRRILPKAEDDASARFCLELLSGRRHRVYTAVTLMHQTKVKHALSMTQVRFRRLLPREIGAYVASKEWQGKAGGYAIQGQAEAFIPWIGGSFSNVVGLPLSETCPMLEAFGVSKA